MINLKTYCWLAMLFCIFVATYSLGMSIWAIIEGNMTGLGISLICLGIMIACTLINYRNYNRSA